MAGSLYRADVSVSTDVQVVDHVPEATRQHIAGTPYPLPEDDTMQYLVPASGSYSADLVVAPRKLLKIRWRDAAPQANISVQAGADLQVASRLPTEAYTNTSTDRQRKNISWWRTETFNKNWLWKTDATLKGSGITRKPEVLW